MKTKKNQIFWHIILILATILFIGPIIFAIGNSFIPMDQLFQSTEKSILQIFSIDNYRRVFERLSLARITLNTFIIASISTVLKVLTSLVAAYSFAYYNFKGKNVLFFLLITTIFVPFTVTMIPNYLLISKLSLNDTLFGVVLPQVADATGIFIIRQAMKNVPNSLIEMGQLEGISSFYIAKDIIFPIIRPSVISTGIIFFINSWNEYLWPMLILKSNENFTLPLALQTYISAEAGTDFPVAMAVSTITMALPLILFIIFQKKIINTFSMTGIKG